MSLNAFWCWWLLDHKWEETDSEYQPVEMSAMEGSPPDPKEGLVYIEQFMTCYHITGLRVVGSVCKRCGIRKTETLSVREGPPLRISSWMAISAEGRVVHPLQVTDSTRSEI